MTTGNVQQGAGISGFGIAEDGETPLSGTGGAAGPGTRAGEGDPSGEGIDTSRSNSAPELSSDQAAREAAALGGPRSDHDLTPALEYGEGDRPNAPTIGEAIGSGAGADVGSGTSEEGSGPA